MSARRYELRLFRGRDELRTASRIHDWFDASRDEETKDLVRRHMLAAADREREVDNAHLFHAEVREVDDDGRVRQSDPLFTVALPVGWGVQWR